MSDCDDYLDLDQLEREIKEANAQLLRHVALCAALALFVGLLTVLGQ